ncbi:hypothetical protein CRENBAI_011588 [Crenichthys baileyi]|uniref:Uncharacterized protein n=1 Tax=Crenichthys baileyi TaxID=28760 RepID=A0AAV9R2E7_9TELE
MPAIDTRYLMVRKHGRADYTKTSSSALEHRKLRPYAQRQERTGDTVDYLFTSSGACFTVNLYLLNPICSESQTAAHSPEEQPQWKREWPRSDGNL